MVCLRQWLQVSAAVVKAGGNRALGEVTKALTAGVHLTQHPPVYPRLVAPPLRALPYLAQRDSVVRLNRLHHALALKVAELPDLFRHALVSASSSPRPYWYFRLRQRPRAGPDHRRVHHDVVNS